MKRIFVKTIPIMGAISLAGCSPIRSGGSGGGSGGEGDDDDDDIRRHRSVLQSYDSVLADPEQAIGRVLTMLGRGDLAKAVASVRDRPAREPTGEPTAPPEFVPVFDELFDRVHRREPLPAAFLQRMNETHLAVLESIGVQGVATSP